MIEGAFILAGKFSEGMAPVQTGEWLNGGYRPGKWGYIDQAGNVVITPQFDWAREFSGGLARVLVDGKWGYVTKTGRYVWKPTE